MREEAQAAPQQGSIADSGLSAYATGDSDRSAPQQGQSSGLPELISLEDGTVAPKAPASLEQTGVEPALLRQMIVKLAYGTYSFVTEWAAESIQLKGQVVDDLLQKLVQEGMLEVLGQLGPFNYRYTITRRGAEAATRYLEISGYAGQAPVSLDAYRAFLQWQIDRFPQIVPQDAAASLSDMVLPEEAVRLAGLAAASGRSLFLSGPAGNGKTTLGRLLHGALRGDLWIPHCVAVPGNVIRIFDPLCHREIPRLPGSHGRVDARWVRIQRPMVVAGGELTIHSLDLAFSPSLRYYEAPLHVKSNGGILLIDDFGRQRVAPHELLNRWIVPLEYGVDHLTLLTGHQIQIPFRQILVFATNLNLSKVTDSAFLRRIGYRLELGNPSPEQYAEIFRRYARSSGVELPGEIVDLILCRYRGEARELRSCHPRDLIDRALDFCRFKGEPPALTAQNLEMAWTGYFGGK